MSPLRNLILKLWFLSFFCGNVVFLVISQNVQSIDLNGFMQRTALPLNYIYSNFIETENFIEVKNHSFKLKVCGEKKRE